MGEVKRYDPSEDAYGNSKGMKWSPYGDYVLAEDYDALLAETYLHEVRLADAYEALELLRAENIGMVAQRMAYAGEFPPDQDGLPDTGSIHQNIRKLRAENAELVLALKTLVLAAPVGHCYSFHHGKKDQHKVDETCQPLVRYDSALDAARATLSKNRGDK